MSRKRPLPGPGQKGSLLYFLKNQPSQKRQTNTLSEQPEQSDQMIETTGQQTEEQHTGQREPETGQREQQTGQTSRGATDRTDSLMFFHYWLSGLKHGDTCFFFH